MSALARQGRRFVVWFFVVPVSMLASLAWHTVLARQRRAACALGGEELADTFGPILLVRRVTDFLGLPAPGEGWWPATDDPPRGG